MKEYTRKWRKKHRKSIRKKELEKIIEPKLIICRLCNETIGIKGISSHLKGSHKELSFNEYVKLYLEDFKIFGWKLCDNCKINLAKTYGRTYWASCSIKCRAQLQSKHYKGRSAWNKGIKASEQTKQLLSKIHKERANRPGYINPATRPEIAKKISESHKKLTSSPTYINPMTGKTHSVDTIKKIFIKKSGTNIENKVKEILINNNIEYIHQFFITKNDICVAYDFKLKQFPILIEVDGDYWHGGPGVVQHFFDVEEVKIKDEYKNNLAIEMGYKIIRVWGSEIKKTPSIILEKINACI